MKILKSAIRTTENANTSLLKKATEQAYSSLDVDTYFFLDASNLVITYLHDGINKNNIEAYSGIKAKARLGRNTIDLIIQPSAMDLLTQVWKVADGFPKCD